MLVIAWPYCPNTAGDVLLVNLDLKGRNKLSVGVSAMLPINQNLANGNIEASTAGPLT
jgi:hypothetical protein